MLSCSGRRMTIFVTRMDTLLPVAALSLVRLLRLFIARSRRKGRWPCGRSERFVPGVLRDRSGGRDGHLGLARRLTRTDGRLSMMVMMMVMRLLLMLMLVLLLRWRKRSVDVASLGRRSNAVSAGEELILTSSRVVKIGVRVRLSLSVRGLDRRSMLLRRLRTDSGMRQRLAMRMPRLRLSESSAELVPLLPPALILVRHPRIALLRLRRGRLRSRCIFRALPLLIERMIVVARRSRLRRFNAPAWRSSSLSSLTSPFRLLPLLPLLLVERLFVSAGVHRLRVGRSWMMVMRRWLRRLYGSSERPRGRYRRRGCRKGGRFAVREQAAH